MFPFFLASLQHIVCTVFHTISAFWKCTCQGLSRYRARNATFLGGTALHPPAGTRVGKLVLRGHLRQRVLGEQVEKEPKSRLEGLGGHLMPLESAAGLRSSVWAPLTAAEDVSMDLVSGTPNEPSPSLGIWVVKVRAGGGVSSPRAFSEVLRGGDI